MAQFMTTRRVEFGDTDSAGIVHFVNYYRYMEQAEHELFRSVGLRIIDKQPDGSAVSWPRVSSSCSFDAPARFEDLLQVRLEVERVGVKSLTYAVEFYMEETRIAHGRLKTVCCRFVTDQPLQSIEIPPQVIEKLEPFTKK